jgi:5,10-methylenetetrahydromethanopterin reductase
MKNLGLLIGEERTVLESINMAQVAEANNFSYVWFGEHVLLRDSLAMVGIVASNTSKISLGTCAINVWTRNIGTTVAAVRTLYEIAENRISIGIAAGEQVLKKFGINSRGVVDAMKEYVQVMKMMFELKDVNFEGKYVKVNNMKLDWHEKLNVPVYIAASGFKMLELAGEIADGAILNFLVTDDYINKAINAINKGLERNILGEKFKIFQLIAVSAGQDYKESMIEGKKLLAKFFYLSPKRFKEIIRQPSVVDEVISIIDKWPPSEALLIKASDHIPDDVVHELMAAGEVSDVIEFIQKTSSKWKTYPILYIVNRDPIWTIKKISYYWDHLNINYDHP